MNIQQFRESLAALNDYADTLVESGCDRVLFASIGSSTRAHVMIDIKDFNRMFSGRDAERNDRILSIKLDNNLTVEACLEPPKPMTEVVRV